MNPNPEPGGWALRSGPLCEPPFLVFFLRPVQSALPPLQGEKNHGFEVLYHSMKQGPISTKELAEFIRER